MKKRSEYYVISPHALAKKITGQLLVLNLKSSECYCLNETGQMLWRGLELEQSFEEIIEAFKNKFSGSFHNFQRDINTTLSQLLKSGLIVKRRKGQQRPRPRIAVGMKPVAPKFNAKYFLRWPGVLDSETYLWVQKNIKTARFYKRQHKRIGAGEDCMKDNAITAALNFLFNSDEVIEFARRLSGNKKIQGFYGRIYRMKKDRFHVDEWHSDLVMGRCVAMSLNLSRRPYGGGDLYMKDWGASRRVHRVENRRKGQAIFFKLDEMLKHKLCAVTKGEKIAFAGWFTVTPGPFASR